MACLFYYCKASEKGRQDKVWHCTEGNAPKRAPGPLPSPYGRSFADDVDGANLAVSHQGDGGPRSGGRGLEMWAAALGGRMDEGLL